MDAICTDNHHGIQKLLDTMSTSVDIIAAFSIMLEHALRAGDDLSHWGNGMTHILNQQCEDLEFIQGALREQVDTIRKEKLELQDIHDVADMAGVSVELAAQIVTFATGVNYLYTGKLPAGQSHG